MAWTRADFYIAFPEFDLTDYTGVTPVPNAREDAVVDAKIAVAIRFVDANRFATVPDGDKAAQYYAAHLLACSPGGLYARLQKSRGDDNLTTSEDVYWKEYVLLARQAGSTPMAI